MRLFTKYLRKRRETRADVQFRRFIELNASRLKLNGGQAINPYPSRDGKDIALACREWLPNLSSPDDRELCAAIADHYDPVPPLRRRTRRNDSTLNAFQAASSESLPA